MKVVILIAAVFSVIVCEEPDADRLFQFISNLGNDVDADTILYETPDFASPKDSGISSDLTSLEEPFPLAGQASILSSDILPHSDDDDDEVYGILDSKSKNSIFDRSTESNLSSADTANSTAKGKNKTVTVECLLRQLPDSEIPLVSVTNSSVLHTVLTPNTTNATVGECAVVLFYSSQCVFSARMAPHYNALARVFPGIMFYALDTVMYSSIHVRYGIVSVPNVLLFHHGKPVARCNDTQLNLENLVSFVTKYTNLQFNGTLNVTSADMSGPVPAALVKRVDYVLILAWLFTIFCICLWFLKSSLCHRIVECVRNTWLEAEAQHEHTD